MKVESTGRRRFAVGGGWFLRRYFGEEFAAGRFGRSFQKFIHERRAVGKFLFEYLASHCLLGHFKKFLNGNDPDFFVELTPKNFQRIF